MLGAALAVGLALLFPAASPATPGRTAPADPAFVQYLQDARGGQDRGLGLVPGPIAWTEVPRTHFAPLMARFPDRFAPASMAAAASPQAAVASAGVQTAAAPATYDLRTAGKLSPVRDQGRYGTCWAFAALASLESSLLPGAANDFSENNMASRSGFALGYGSGRQQLHGGGLPAALGRPRERGRRPLRSRTPATPNPSPADAAVGTHVHDVLELPARKSAADNADLKWAVMTYGAVYTSMCWSATAFRDSSDAYYYAGSSSAEPRRDARRLGRLLPGVQVRHRAGRTWRVPRPQQLGHDVRAGRLLLGLLLRHRGSPPTTPSSPAPSRRPPQSGSTSTTRSAGSPRTGRPAPPIRPRRGSPRRTRRRRRARSPPPASTPRRRTPPTRSASRTPWRPSATPPSSATGTLAVPGYHTVALDAPVTLSAGQPLVIAVRVTTPGYGFPVAVERPVRRVRGRDRRPPARASSAATA